MHFGSRFLLWLLICLIGLTAVVLLIISRPGGSYQQETRLRQQAVDLTGLPDLALGHQAVWIRHRSLAAPFAVFPEDGALLEYYPGSFIYYLKPPEEGARSHEP